jgi:TrmH family RNA methyltransferase
MDALKKYKKDFEYSYAYGMFPTVELIKSRPSSVLKVLVSSGFKPDSSSLDIFELCKKYSITAEVNDKLFNKISEKENCYVIGVFEKYKSIIEPDKPHIVLVNPSNMGNMGTIVRTLTGFGLNDLAIISPGADIFDPKVIRASMGSLFRINFEYFDSFAEYKKKAGGHRIYTFMLDGATSLKEINHDKRELFSLVFGNEATGLDKSYAKEGKSIVIKHTDRIDSLNLPIAASIAMYEFCS